MRTRTVLDGNAFYEIGEECLEKKEEQERKGKEAEKAAEMLPQNRRESGRKRGRE